MSAKEIADKIIKCFKSGGKILVCGNGGSCAETEHMVSEFVTHGLPAISLNYPATITAIANDKEFKQIFAYQVAILGKLEDILIGLSTSGKSENILQAYKIAKKMGIGIIDWPRKGKDTASIQEFQLKLMHRVYKKILV
jgi:phosphoheptose isomerase